MTTLKDQMKQDAEQHGLGNNDFFRFDKSGNYRFRLLTPVMALATHFFGKGVSSSVCYGRDKGCPFHVGEERASVKYIAHVIDRTDGQVKLGELPWTVVKEISNWENDEDYRFDSYPMPYDVKVTVDKDAAPADIYKATPAPQRTEITPEESKALDEKLKKITPEQFVENRKKKQLEKHQQDGTWQKEQERRQKLADNLDELAAQRATNNGDGEVNPDDIPF